MARTSGVLFSSCSSDRRVTIVVSARAVVDVVRDDVRQFVAGAEQADDITLMAIRWLGRDSG